MFRVILFALGASAFVELIGHNTLAQGVWDPVTQNYQLVTPAYEMNIKGNGFRFGFNGPDFDPIEAHPQHGMTFGGAPIQSILDVNHAGSHDEIRVQAANGTQGMVEVYSLDHAVRFRVRPDKAAEITTQIAGLSDAPAYGLADAALSRWRTNLAGGTFDVTRNDGVLYRFGSSFMIHPSRGVAGVSFYPSDTTVVTDSNQYSITSHNTGGAGDFKDVDVYYFLGDPPDVYSAYKSARTAQRYPDVFPKSRLFEIGWESWDRLSVNANGERVRNEVQGFLDQGYPIKWLVTGSGFWQPQHKTTSFGYIDQSVGEYPDPSGPIGPGGAGFGTWTEQEDLAWLIGQRTAFVTPREGVVNGLVEGPFTREADEGGYFVSNLDGSRFENSTSWAARTPTWLLDGSNPDAAEWFQQKFDLWKAHGIDGVKEDTGATENLKRMDAFNGAMKALADTGSMVMARNGVFTMPGTLHRINDTWGNFSNRAVITWLQYAASAAPNVYADSIGYSYMDSDPQRAIRNAWVQSLTAGMTFSESPWGNGWSQADQDVMRKVVEFRYGLTPYIYSAAVDSYKTGFPYTMTPLYLAYPDDVETYNLANTVTDQYEWMVGPSLLVTPYFEGLDDLIDIYLPAGQWIDYNTGVRYQGGQTLNDFPMAVDQAPIFVGGQGILVQRHREELTLWGEIYPVSPSGASYTFTHMDGISQTKIEADHAMWDPSQMEIRDQVTGANVPFELDSVTGALRFSILAGHDYRLFSLTMQPGDFNHDGLLDVADVDLLQRHIRSGSHFVSFDLTHDALVDSDDLAVWVTNLKRTWTGDANLDGEFNTSDILSVMVAGEYEDEVMGNSGWASGDWNSDADFTTADLVMALADGGYEAGRRPAAVPEPTTGVLLVVGAICCVRGARLALLDPAVLPACPFKSQT